MALDRPKTTKSIKKRFTIYADGCSRGNPGPSAIGAVILDGSGAVVGKISESIGKATNNQAEYRALLAGLELAAKLGAKYVEIKLDSELVVRQIKSEYRVKNPELRCLLDKVSQLLQRFASVNISHITHEQNKMAHDLANQAIRSSY